MFMCACFVFVCFCVFLCVFAFCVCFCVFLSFFLLLSLFPFCSLLQAYYRALQLTITITILLLPCPLTTLLLLYQVVSVVLNSGQPTPQGLIKVGVVIVQDRVRELVFRFRGRQVGVDVSLDERQLVVVAAFEFCCFLFLCVCNFCLCVLIVVGTSV